ncbi:beta-4C adrenergic receptor-like isoform X2 [Hoplias malabaricus]|uniref:beta-4C adrenergic receptor-like isoform X2 n=1 Tax=Hoplias malabaricus TaxID=27720 RepID=UPI003461C9BB
MLILQGYETQLIVFRTPQLRGSTGVFFASLALADLVVGAVIQPLSLVGLLTKTWPLGKMVCDLWLSLDVLGVTASTQTLCTIALDRYVAITRPLRYKALLDKRRARFIAGVVWIVSTLISFVPIFGDFYRAHGNSSINGSEETRGCDFNPNKTYAIASSLISFYLPLLVMLFVYGQVFIIASRQVKTIKQGKVRFTSRDDSQIHEEQEGSTELDVGRRLFQRSMKMIMRQHRVLKTLGLIMGGFTVCWLPFFVMNIFMAFQTKTMCYWDTVLFWLNWLGYFNSTLNPFIYFHSAEYRAAFQALLLKPRICRGLAPSSVLVRLCKLLQNHCPCLSRHSRQNRTDPDPDSSTENQNSEPHDQRISSVRPCFKPRERHDVVEVTAPEPREV